VTATVPVHRDATVTERAAARRASCWADSLEALVLAAVIAAGDQGLTALEAREALGLPVERHYSVAPRLSALKRKKLIEPTFTARDNYMAYRAATAARGEVAA
jgi:hypothetical protein